MGLTIAQVASYFEQLKDGLEGALYVSSADSTGKQDGYLIVASGESISNLQLCALSSTTAA